MAWLQQGMAISGHILVSCNRLDLAEKQAALVETGSDQHSECGVNYSGALPFERSVIGDVKPAVLKIAKLPKIM